MASPAPPAPTPMLMHRECPVETCGNTSPIRSFIGILKMTNVILCTKQNICD